MKAGRDRPENEIEITPEMIEAGVDVLIESGILGEEPIRSPLRVVIEAILLQCHGQSNLPKIEPYRGVVA